MLKTATDIRYTDRAYNKGETVSIQLLLTASSSSDVTIDVMWGDGSSDYYVGGHIVSISPSHVFRPGTYIITAVYLNSNVPQEKHVDTRQLVIRAIDSEDSQYGIIFGPGIPDKGFITKVDEDLLRDNIIIALSTQVGSRIGDPSFGSNLHNIIFSTDPVEITTLVDEEVKRVISKHEPRVNFVSSNIDIQGKQCYASFKFNSLLSNKLIEVPLSYLRS